MKICTTIEEMRAASRELRREHGRRAISLDPNVRHPFAGDRETVRRASVRRALELVLQFEKPA